MKVSWVGKLAEILLFVYHYGHITSSKRGRICLPKFTATLNCIAFKRFNRNYTKTVNVMLNERLQYCNEISGSLK